MENKRGLSTVVATILIILLTIVAIALLAQFFIPFVNDKLDKSSECLNAQDYFSFDDRLGLNCYDTAANQVKFSVKSKGDSALSTEIAGFRVNYLLTSDTGGTIENSEVTGTTITSGLSKIGGGMGIPNPGDTYSYAYSTATRFTKAEIYTIVKSGRSCEKTSDSVNIRIC